MVMRRRSAEFKVAGSLGTAWAEEHSGPIQSWEDLEKYPWPDPDAVDYGQLEYYERHLPEDMGVFHVVKVGEVVRELFGFDPFSTVAFPMYCHSIGLRRCDLAVAPCA